MTLLQASQVSVSFGGIHALSDVQVEVAPGEAVGLIGPNGAGKTTFFNCLLGLQQPDWGTVRFKGRELGEMPVYKRARMGIGRTFQRLELFPGMTVRDHLLVALRSYTKRGGLLHDLALGGGERQWEASIIEDIAVLVGLGERLDTVVDTLGLGHCRLLEVARALMTDPEILLLDEPSSGLDTNESMQLVDVLLTVQRVRGTALLLVEHDLELIRHTVSKLYVLDLGRLICVGPTEAVLADPRVREAYIGNVA